MDKSSTITINGNAHRLSALLLMAETLPTIKLDMAIDLDHKFETQQSGGYVELDNHKTAVVIKHGDQAYVIAGRHKLKSGSREVKLVSSVALKRFRIQ